METYTFRDAKGRELTFDADKEPSGDALKELFTQVYGPDTVGTLEGNWNALKSGIAGVEKAYRGMQMDTPQIYDVPPAMTEPSVQLPVQMADGKLLSNQPTLGGTVGLRPDDRSLYEQSQTGTYDEQLLANSAQQETKLNATKRLLELHKYQQSLPKSEAGQELANVMADPEATFGQKLGVFARNPIENTVNIGLESAPTSIVGATIGSLVGGAGAVATGQPWMAKTGMMAGTGLSSGMATYVEELIGMAPPAATQNEEAFQAWLGTPEGMAAVTKAKIKGGVVGGVDAASAGVAGRFVGPALIARAGLRKTATALAKETATQAVAGAGGEGFGQWASRQKFDPMSMFLEAAAEGITGPVTEGAPTMLKAWRTGKREALATQIQGGFATPENEDLSTVDGVLKAVERIDTQLNAIEQRLGPLQDTDATGNIIPARVGTRAEEDLLKMRNGLLDRATEMATAEAEKLQQEEGRAAWEQEGGTTTDTIMAEPEDGTVEAIRRATAVQPEAGLSEAVDTDVGGPTLIDREIQEGFKQPKLRTGRIVTSEQIAQESQLPQQPLVVPESYTQPVEADTTAGVMQTAEQRVEAQKQAQMQAEFQRTREQVAKGELPRMQTEQVAPVPFKNAPLKSVGQKVQSKRTSPLRYSGEERWTIINTKTGEVIRDSITEARAIEVAQRNPDWKAEPYRDTEYTSFYNNVADSKVTTVDQALDNLAQSPNADVAKLATTLKKLSAAFGKSAKLKVDRNTTSDQAFYDPFEHSITLSNNPGFSVRTPVHEIGHALTSIALQKYVPLGNTKRYYTRNEYLVQLRKVFRAGDTPAPVREIVRLYLHALEQTKNQEYVHPNARKSEGGAAYGWANVDEFVAEAWTNPEFAAQLRAMPATRAEYKSLWDELRAAVRKFVKHVMAKDFTAEERTLLDEVLDASFELVQENEKVAERGGMKVPASSKQAVTDKGFSQLQDEVLDTLPEEMDGQKMYTILRNKGVITNVEHELFQKNGANEFFAAGKTVTTDEAREWFQKNGFGLAVHTYGMEGKVSEAKREYDKMTHEWYEKLPQKIQADIEGYNNNADYPEIREKIVNRIYQETNGKVTGHSIDEYLDLRNKVRNEPRDTSPRATSYYSTVSALDTTKPMPEWTKTQSGKNVQRVDVVVPQKRVTRTAENTYKWEKSKSDTVLEPAIWQPDSLHENLPNTLGWAMIQYVDGPKGERVALVVEAQSRWGQEVSAAKAKAKTDERQNDSVIDTLETDHPLLDDYNRLILKAAIAQAKKEGATHVVVSDAETAMMSEGHDAYVDNRLTFLPTPENVALAKSKLQEGTPRKGYMFTKDLETIANGEKLEIAGHAKDLENLRAEGWKLEPKGVIAQEGGMRAAYDKALPAIAEKLTGVKGERVELGNHKNAMGKGVMDPTYRDMQTRDYSKPRDNLIFKNTDGTPKTSITGQMFALDTVPERSPRMTGRIYANPVSRTSSKQFAQMLAKTGLGKRQIQLVLKQHGFDVSAADDLDVGAIQGEPAKPVGLRVESLEAIRKDAGLPRAIELEKTTMPELAKEAREKVANDPTLVDKLLADLNNDPRAPRGWELMALMDELAKRVHTAELLEAESTAAKTVGERNELRMKAEVLRVSLDEMTDIMRRGSRESGLSLRVLQEYERDQMTESYLRHKFRTARGAKGLQPEDIEAAKTLAAKYAKVVETFGQEKVIKYSQPERQRYRDVNALIKWLESKKATIDKTKINAALWPGLDSVSLAKVYNAALDAAIGALRAGKQIDAAVRIAMAHMRNEKVPHEQLMKFRTRLTNALATEVDGAGTVQERDAKRAKSATARVQQAQNPTPRKQPSLKTMVERKKIREEVDAVLSKIKYDELSAWGKGVRSVAETLNLQRTFQTAYDLSMIGLQLGPHSLAHPVATAKMMPKTLRAAMSDDFARTVEAEIESSPFQPLYKQAGLEFLGHSTLELAKIDENMVSKWAHRWPGIKASNRAFVTMSNMVRKRMFDALVMSVSDAGDGSDLTQKELKGIGFFINNMTGRGPLPGKAAAAGQFLSTVLYAPRFMVSRAMLLTGMPLLMAGSGRVRKAIAWEMTRSILGYAAFMGLMAFAGGEIEWDPEKADFAKVKFGNTRINATAGLSQYIVLLTRLGNAIQRNVRGLPKSDYDIGTTLERFAKSKLAPTISSSYAVATQRDFMGDKYANAQSSLLAQVLGAAPLGLQEPFKMVAKPVIENADVGGLKIPPSWEGMDSIWEEHSLPRAMAAQVLQTVGLNVQHYDVNAREARKKAQRRQRSRVSNR